MPIILLKCWWNCIHIYSVCLEECWYLFGICFRSMPAKAIWILVKIHEVASSWRNHFWTDQWHTPQSVYWVGRNVAFFTLPATFFLPICQWTVTTEHIRAYIF